MTKTLQKLLSFAAIGVALLAPQTADAQYCSTNHSYGCYYRMSSFSTSGGTTNISDPSISCSSSWGPTNPNTSHTTTSVTAMLNTSVNFTMGLSYMWGLYSAIWVDWNADGDFNDAGEQVSSRTSSQNYWMSSVTGSFTVPSTASVGTTRMRVMTNMYNSPTPCFNSWDYGNTVDYTFIVTSPCASVPSVAYTAYSKSAVFNWPATPGSVSYDYKVTLGANPNGAAIGSGNTTSTTATVAGLTPSTSYYIHLKNRCAVYPASWASWQFQTSACAPPVPSFANITHNSAMVLWSSVSIATRYEYFVSTDPNPPASTATLNTSSSSSVQLNNLDARTTYYVYIRSVCGSATSEWDVASFTTMTECDAPEVTIIKTGANEVEANWQPIETAIAYEYAINSSATAPALGTTVYDNTVKFPLPDDKKAYYFHIRSKCVSIFNTSDWKTEMLREGDPTAIRSANSDLLVQVYPNPANNIVVVQVEGLQQVKGEIAVTDITGKVVLTAEANSSKTSINVGALAAGAYFIKYSDGNLTQTFRINKL